MLLFHMSIVPKEFEDIAGELNGALDQSLRSFEGLKRKVDDYVKLLAASSTYRTLIESSVTIFNGLTISRIHLQPHLADVIAYSLKIPLICQICF